MNKVNVKSPLKKLTFGGLQEYNSESIELRKQQILDDFRLHSCYDYNESLKVIRKASEETQLIPKMITKVYFNFRRNNSFITILDQLYRITDRLKFIPKEWHIQICVNPPLTDFSNDEYLRFQQAVQKNFGEVKYFIETEKLWEKNTSKVINSNYVDGSCFFMNGFFRAIDNNCFTSNPFITFGMLAGGHNHIKKYKRYYDNNLKKNSKLEHSDIIKKNIIFFLNLNKNINFEYAITSTSSKKNYENLINQISILDNLNSHLNGEIELDDLIDIYSFQNSDTYGIKYSKKPYHKYIYNKKRVLHEILTSVPFINYSKKWL
jgi:hypothetical protein